VVSSEPMSSPRACRAVSSSLNASRVNHASLPGPKCKPARIRQVPTAAVASGLWPSENSAEFREELAVQGRRAERDIDLLDSSGEFAPRGS